MHCSSTGPQCSFRHNRPSASPPTTFFGLRHLRNCTCLVASYLHRRTQSVVIDGEESEPVDLEFGVPQGSVLGPKFYTIYVNALRKVLEPYGIRIKQYSDDTTIYLEFTFPPDVPDQFDALRILSSCAGDLINWSTFNFVKLNPAKSDFLYFAPAELADKLPLLPLRVGEEPLQPSTSAKVLGVILSSDLSMDRQIASISKICQFQPLSIRQDKKLSYNRGNQDPGPFSRHFTS